MEKEIEKLRKQLKQERTLKEMYLTYYQAKHSDIKGEFFKLKVENEELKKANKHIEYNRIQKANKLMRIERILRACESGYSDEFTQSLLEIVLEAEPAEEELNTTEATNGNRN